VQAKGRIPDWAEPMIEYNKAVEWMRRQHWKNNKNKGELALGLSEGAASKARVADDGLGVASSVGDAGARDGDENRARAGPSGFWSNVLH